MEIFVGGWALVQRASSVGASGGTGTMAIVGTIVSTRTAFANVIATASGARQEAGTAITVGIGLFIVPIAAIVLAYRTRTVSPAATRTITRSVLSASRDSLVAAVASWVIASCHVSTGTIAPARESIRAALTCAAATAVATETVHTMTGCTLRVVRTRFTLRLQICTF